MSKEMTSVTKPILYVENTCSKAARMDTRFKFIPGFSLIVVADADNAAKAVLGEAFTAWLPVQNKYVEKEGTKFAAVLWDNLIPAKAGEEAQENMGLNTALKLKDSDLAPFFIACSSDSNPEKFKAAFPTVLNINDLVISHLEKAFTDLGLMGQPAADAKKD